MICQDTKTRCVVATHPPHTTCGGDGWTRAIRADELLNMPAWPFDDGDQLVGPGWTLDDEALDVDLDEADAGDLVEFGPGWWVGPGGTLNDEALDEADASDLDEFGPGWWVDPDAEAMANFHRDITPRGGWR